MIVMAVERSSPSQGSFVGSFNRKKRMPVDGKSSEQAGIIDDALRSQPEIDVFNTEVADDIPEIEQENSDPIL